VFAIFGTGRTIFSSLTTALNEASQPLTTQARYLNPSELHLSTESYRTLLSPQYQMAPANAHQASGVPRDPFIQAVPHQPHNHAQQNAWVSFRRWDILHSTSTHSSMCIPQVPPAPPNGQREGHREDIPPPVRDIAGPQDPRHFDVAYQGDVVDYHPQPIVGVSDSHLSATEPLFRQ
jgi:hypothetical protein